MDLGTLDLRAEGKRNGPGPALAHRDRATMGRGLLRREKVRLVPGCTARCCCGGQERGGAHARSGLSRPAWERWGSSAAAKAGELRAECGGPGAGLGVCEEGGGGLGEES